MKVHELNLTTKKDQKRVGRGISAGQGKTAGRGTKGQNSRTGGGVRIGFEGGQNPLAKRLPKKRGFVPIKRTRYQVVNLAQLETLKTGATIAVSDLVAAGLVKNPHLPVKLLGQGELTKKFSITVQAVSASAKKSVTAAGGTITIATLTRKPTKRHARANEPSKEA